MSFIIIHTDIFQNITKMTSFTLWIRLKDYSAIDRCITHLGEMYNNDKPYKDFPAHITLVPSISSKHPNMEKEKKFYTLAMTLKKIISVLKILDGMHYLFREIQKLRMCFLLMIVLKLI